MRIDLVNTVASQIANEAGSQATGAQSASVAPREEDRATLVSNAGSVNSLVSAAMSSPEIRADKVASLQQAISSGKYQIDPAKIAASMIDEHA
ncbi:MAG: flagellar biosynthesis anti-sigma factor FlgM [Acidobacteriota bacterium]